MSAPISFPFVLVGGVFFSPYSLASLKTLSKELAEDRCCFKPHTSGLLLSLL